MPAKMRLQRRGKKGAAFYHIVIADGRAPRDGKFIESIGRYNPVSKPAVIELDFEKALEWIQNGAYPTDTVRAILKHKGVMYKLHLIKGMKKGALTAEQVETKFQSWITQKESKVNSKIVEEKNNARSEDKKRIEAEVKVAQKKAAVIAEKLAKAANKNKEEDQPQVDSEEPTTENQ